MNKYIVFTAYLEIIQNNYGYFGKIVQTARTIAKKFGIICKRFPKNTRLKEK